VLFQARVCSSAPAQDHRVDLTRFVRIFLTDAAEMLPEPNVTVLGQDSAQRRKFNINCYSFQQDAVVTFNGWQYACFYSFLESEPSGASPEPLYVHVARRQLPRGEWEVVVLDDYSQTTDDGHNTVQMGICPEDGTIHLSFDHHCDT
jgi:hypothetical protein